jgi:hypothetical protein
MIPRGGLACLYGPSGAGKSFMALDWGLHIAAGARWYEQDTQAGTVIYIAAEGARGLPLRSDAWQARHGRPVADDAFLVWDEAVNLMDPPAVELLLADVQNRAPAPALIIVDTLARCMAGGDENTTRDMNQVIAGADHLRAATGATVLLVHHTGKNIANGERGSSALRGAVDTMIALETNDTLIRLSCDKQKDAAPFDTSTWQLMPEGESCVVAPASVSTIAGTRGRMSDQQRRVLEAIASPVFTDGARNKDITDATGYNSMAILRALESLMGRGNVRAEGLPKHRDRRYFLTEAGAAYLTNTNKSLPVTNSESSHPTTQSLTNTNTPLWGVSDVSDVSDSVSDPVPPAKQEEIATDSPAPPRYSAPPLGAPPMPTGPHTCEDPGCQWLWLRSGGWVRTCQDAKHLAAKGSPRAS